MSSVINKTSKSMTIYLAREGYVIIFLVIFDIFSWQSM
jgi:hypothetical protein